MRSARSHTLLTAAALVVLAVVAQAVVGAETGAEEPDLQHRWNLQDLYPSAEAWTAARQEVAAGRDALAACAGRLGESADGLLGCLDTYFGLIKQTSRVGVYASTLSDSDMRVAEAMEMRQQAGMLGTELRQAASFLDPELLAVGAERISQLLAEEPKLSTYKHFLDNTLRQQPHTLSTEGESIIATAGMMQDAPYSIYSILTSTDIPWPTVTLSDGTEARLDQAGYTRHRAAAERADRKLVFDTFWKTWKDYERTCGVALYSQVKRDLFYARSRKHPSCLAAALYPNNVPEKVYTTLIESTNAHLGTLHRYLRLRARMLGVDDLGYHDAYPALVATDLEFPIERGKELVLAAVAALGDEYVSTIDHGFSNRWMDVYPRQAKRPGAYSSGRAYDVHPYVLMNYTDDYGAASTLAHEWGHAMHSHLANSTQPFATSGYSIFVAEVASTFNEALLLDHVLSTAEDDNDRLYYLGSALESLRLTFFRQAMFAEFELAIHDAVERGDALSGQRLTEIYGDILRRYHGHDEGVMHIDDAYTVEWAYIPHFFYNFYVYQYATSLAASALFADEVLAGKEGAREDFLGVLRAGGSEYPYELLKRAGVDLASTAPYEALVARMERIMDQIEEILDRSESS